MRKLLMAAILVGCVSHAALAADKENGNTTLKNVQPAGTTDKKHKKQQYDLTFDSTKNEYTCRTNENEKVNATDWVVGSSINYKVDGNKGDVKNIQSGKNAKCTIVRMAVVPANSN